MNRRDFLKTGALAGGVVWLGSAGAPAALPTSPMILSPFTDDLRVPAPLAPSDRGWQSPFHLPIETYYRIQIRRAAHSFTSSKVQPIGANGQPIAVPGAGPGPMNYARYGTPLVVHFESLLQGWTGSRWNDRNPNQWFHDYRLDHAGANVYSGMAGLYLLYDDKDAGDESRGLRLPGVPNSATRRVDYDLPLVISDVRLDDGVTPHVGRESGGYGMTHPCIVDFSRYMDGSAVSAGDVIYLTNTLGLRTAVPLLQIVVDGEMVEDNIDPELPRHIVNFRSFTGRYAAQGDRATMFGWNVVD